MRHRSRPKKPTGRIVAQCTRWDPLGWGFCVPNEQPNRSIYVHCSKVVGAGEGFVKLHKYAMYEFNILPPEPGKRYERATDITLPGGEPIPLEPKVLRNMIMEERKKRETQAIEDFFSSRSTSDGGHDSSFQSDDPKQRDDSSCGELSREAESIELSRSSGPADSVEYEHHIRRYPPGLGGKYARDRRKAAQLTKATQSTNNYREAKYQNYIETSRSERYCGTKTHTNEHPNVIGAAEAPNNFVRDPPRNHILSQAPHQQQMGGREIRKPNEHEPPESAWKDIPIIPERGNVPPENLETEWSPVTDSDWTDLNPPPKFNLNFPCQRDHAIWSSNDPSQSLWSPIYFDSAVKEERRPCEVKDHEIPWDPVISSERKVWEPVLVDSKSPWHSAV